MSFAVSLLTRMVAALELWKPPKNVILVVFIVGIFLDGEDEEKEVTKGLDCDF